MQQLLVKVANQEKAQMLLNLLKSLDFIESVETIPDPVSNSQNEADFFALAGLWENRDLTTDSIRQEAWKE